MQLLKLFLKKGRLEKKYKKMKWNKSLENYDLRAYPAEVFKIFYSFCIEYASYTKKGNIVNIEYYKKVGT